MIFNCLSSINSNYHMSISRFLEDIDPILPNLHFMILKRYCLHITKFTFHMWDIFVPYSRFWKYKRTFLIVRSPIFSNRNENVDFQYFWDCPNAMFPTLCRELSWILWNTLVGPELKLIGFGNHGHAVNPEIMKTMGFRFSQSEIEK